VLIATCARTDAAREARDRADKDLLESGIALPPGYEAAHTVFTMFSPATLDDEVSVRQWLDIFELSGAGLSAGGQLWADLPGDRRPALRSVGAPCRVISFTDDLITPPHLAAEVADAIPDCDVVAIDRCGHLGYLERPDAVNAAIVEFLDSH
jgi:pimeloyl-ACP methyl ester carboxylesterase